MTFPDLDCLRGSDECSGPGIVGLSIRTAHNVWTLYTRIGWRGRGRRLGRGGRRHGLRPHSATSPPILFYLQLLLTLQSKEEDAKKMQGAIKGFYLICKYISDTIGLGDKNE